MNPTPALSLRDQQVIWHPYTQHQGMLPPVPIVRGEGALLFDESGKQYIDAISSWWVNIHGHGHPYIAEKIFEQAKTLEHVIFTGFTHEPAVRLAERLLAILPGKMEKCFYSDNGSTAVEVALKMVIQFWRNTGRPEKKKILAFRDAYHGDTFGAMSVSGRGLFTAAFGDFLFDVTVIDTPNPDNIADLQQLLREGKDRFAGFIYEPLLQAAGGMLMYPAASLDQLVKTARENGILCIADEVLTGFGRTGTLFAGNQLRESADIICLSKGITGGAMALGLTACTAEVFDAFLSEDRSRTLFHGHSYTANPLACAAGLASLDLLQKKACTEQIQALTEKNRLFAEELKTAEQTTAAGFRNIRTLGTVLAFETGSEKPDYRNAAGRTIQQAAMAEGIYLRPLGNTVYLMPPYAIRPDELAQCYAFLRRVPELPGNGSR